MCRPAAPDACEDSYDRRTESGRRHGFQFFTIVTSRRRASGSGTAKSYGARGAADGDAVEERRRLSLCRNASSGTFG